MAPETETPPTLIGGNTMWWRWTATESGPFAASIAGSDINVGLGVYTGASLAGLAELGNNHVPFSRPSVEFAAVVGTTYWFATGTAEGNTGFVRLTLAPAGKPVLFSPIPGSGGLELELFSQPNLVVRLESSTNLLDWVPSLHVTNTAGWMKMTVEQDDSPARFFRAAQ